MNAKSSRPLGAAASALCLVCASLLAGCGGARPEPEADLAGLSQPSQTLPLPHEAHSLRESVRPMDIAINGGGMFVLLDVDRDELVFTRRGRFDIDREGRLIDEANRLVVGLPSDAALQTDAARVYAPLPKLPPTVPPRASTTLSVALNLDAGADLIPSGPSLKADDATGYHFSTSVSLYDAAGQPVTLMLFFCKVDVARWQVVARVHGVTPSGGEGFIRFGPTGTPVDLPLVWRLDIPAGGSGVTRTLPISGLQLDLSGLTQYGASFGGIALRQDGAPAGSLAAARVEADGRVYAAYSNGDVVERGQVLLGRFTIADRLIRRPAATYVCGSPCAPVLSLPGRQYGVGILISGALDDEGG